MNEDEKQTPDATDKPEKCVLVVDDSAAVRYTVVHIIQRMGYEVIEAADGSEVLPLAEKYHPDLIFLDVHMPEKGGLEALRELRADARFKGTPVIVLTASADQKIVRQAASLKISGYLVKASLAAGDIRERINKIFDAPAAPGIGRQTRRSLRILLADEVWERCQEVGMDAYVAKPVEPDKLFTTLEEMSVIAPAPPASEPQQEVLFDWDELLERVDDDVELLQRMLDLFCRDYPTLLEEARQAIAAGDPQILHDSAHALTGMLGNLSAHAMVAIAQQLEEVDPVGEAQQAREALANLEVRVEQLARALTASLELDKDAGS